jgi:hypothetical protein
MTQLCWLGLEEVMTVDTLLPWVVVAGEKAQHKYYVLYVNAMQNNYHELRQLNS